MLSTGAGTLTAEDRASILPPRPLPASQRDAARTEGASVTACLSDIESVVGSLWGPGIHFRVQVSADLPLLACDRARLATAIMNLLFNARDAMPDGGTISVAAAEAHAGHAAIELRVTDSGVGMNEDTARRAVEPFFTTKSTGLGGLGLPLVKSFAEEAGGRLLIESRPGVGTAVTLLLPVSAASAGHRERKDDAN